MSAAAFAAAGAGASSFVDAGTGLFGGATSGATDTSTKSKVEAKESGVIKSKGTTLNVASILETAAEVSLSSTKSEEEKLKLSLAKTTDKSVAAGTESSVEAVNSIIAGLVEESTGAVTKGLQESAEATTGSTTTEGKVDTTASQVASEVSSQATDKSSAQQITGTEQVSSLGPESVLELRGLIGELVSSVGGDQPGLDFAGIRDAAVQSVLDNNMAGVVGQGAASRAFDSTVVGQAGEKIAARAAVAGAGAETSARLSEIQLANEGTRDLLAGIARLFEVEKGAVTDKTTAEDLIATETGTAVGTVDSTSTTAATEISESAEVLDISKIGSVATSGTEDITSTKASTESVDTTKTGEVATTDTIDSTSIASSLDRESTTQDVTESGLNLSTIATESTEKETTKEKEEFKKKSKVKSKSEIEVETETEDEGLLSSIF